MIASHGLNDVTMGVDTSDAVVAHKSTPLLTTASDADVALELDIAPFSVVALVNDVVDPLKNNFLKECDIVAKYWKSEIDMEESISDNGDHVVQTTRRLVKKLARANESDVVLSSIAALENDVFNFLSKYRMNKTNKKNSLSENEDDVLQTIRRSKFFKKGIKKSLRKNDYLNFGVDMNLMLVT